MLRASVAQKPTMAVRDGTKNARKAPVVLNLLGCARIGPKPFARRAAQPSRAKPATIRNGAAQASSRLMALLPRTTMYMFHDQKMKNEIQTPPGTRCQAGKAVVSSVWMA